MELDKAQSIVDLQGDLWCPRVRCELGYGCRTTSSRCVHFLAEQCVTEFLKETEWSGNTMPRTWEAKRVKP